MSELEDSQDLRTGAAPAPSNSPLHKTRVPATTVAASDSEHATQTVSAITLAGKGGPLCSESELWRRCGFALLRGS